MQKYAKNWKFLDENLRWKNDLNLVSPKKRICFLKTLPCKNDMTFAQSNEMMFLLFEASCFVQNFCQTSRITSMKHAS